VPCSPDNFGPAAHVLLDVAPSLPPTGALVVSLWWDTESDLDLHVVDPYGVEIWAGNINSFDPTRPLPRPTPAPGTRAAFSTSTPTARCVIDGRCNENVVWSLTAPAGDYVARVDTFSLCGNSAARWTVEASLNGTLMGRAEGEAVPSSQRFSKGKGGWADRPVVHRCAPMTAHWRVFRAGDTCSRARSHGVGGRHLRDGRDRASNERSRDG
jgi:hypothetical protein